MLGDLLVWVLLKKEAPGCMGWRSATSPSIPVSVWDAFLEGVFGLGHDNIIPSTFFPGYASIGHRSLDLGVL